MFSAASCHYNTLGIKASASAEEIKKAFRLLARNHHPDVSKAPDAEGRFKAISAAYEVLGSQSRRADYDGSRRSGDVFGRAPGTGMRHGMRPRPRPQARPRRRADGFGEMPFAEALMVAMMYIIPFGGLLYLGVDATLNPVGGAGGARDNSLIPLCYNPKTKIWEEYNYHAMAGQRGLKVRWVNKDQLERRQAAEAFRQPTHVMESVPYASGERKLTSRRTDRSKKIKRKKTTRSVEID